MYIISQNKEDIVNLDNASFVGIYDTYVKVWFIDDDYTIGQYDTVEEAKRVIEQIVAFLEEPCNVNNRIFRMPPRSRRE